MRRPRCLTRLAPLLAVVSSLLAPGPAMAQKVLLVADDDPVGTGILGAALRGAGMAVTQTAVPSWQYDGTNPVTAGFDVIVLLAGTSNARANDMPAGGQTAIVNFVSAGGGLVATEWAAYQVSAGRFQTLKPLVLLQRTGGAIGQIDYAVGNGLANHPLWAGLPASFSFASASNVGTLLAGPGVVRLATSVAAGDGVVYRDVLNIGRIVELSTAGNYSNGTFGNVNLQLLMTNATSWASKSRVNLPPVASAGGPYMVDEGGSVMLSGTCTDPDMDGQTLTWDFQGKNQYTDGMGASPVFSAANLSGPKTVAVSLKCTDTGNLSGTAMAMVVIRDIAPIFKSMPPTTALEGSLYSYDASVYDPGPMDVLGCSLVSGPVGMSVVGGCQLQWLPTYDQARAGKQDVKLAVKDQNGSTSTQSWTITVAFIDSDKDGLPDTWETMYFGNLAQGPGDDPDMDGRPNLKEFQDGTDPTKYDGPSAPTIVSPDLGVHAGTKAALTIANANDAHGDPIVYQYEVYSDANLHNLIDVNINVPQGMGTSFYTSIALREDQHYWWRARARDPYVGGPWSTVATFFASDIHEAPSGPGISMPIDQSKVDSIHPTLEVTNAHSSDELALTYTFEVYSDQGMTMLADQATGVVAGKGSTSHAVMSNLTPYAHYFWRAKATDSLLLDGPWNTASFFVAPLNTPPTDPIISSPTEGQRITRLTPMIVVGGSIDLDDEKPIKYTCDLDSALTFDSPEKQSSPALLPADPMVNQAQWTPAPLVQAHHYCVRCRAFDPSGTSRWAQTCFLIDPVNQAPSVPVLQNPSDSGLAAGDVVRFTWVNSLDPEGDALHYELEVYSDAALSKRVAAGQADDGPTGLTLVGLPPGTLLWRARAIDVFGAASDWSRPNQFIDTATANSAAGAGGCGCRVSRPPSRPTDDSRPLCLLALMAAAVLGRRAQRRR